MEFKIFGWGGFLFEIPQDMDLVSEGGDTRSGYMRLEAKDYFFEIRWEELRKGAKPLAEVVDAFIKRLEKDSKYKITYGERRSTVVFNHKAFYLLEKSNVKGYIYFWHCEESRRMIMFRLAFISLGKSSRTIVKQALSSFKCHGEQSNLWTLFNSSIRAPPSFQPTERKMLVGRVYLILQDRKISLFTERRKEILFEYFTTANIQFEKDYRDIDKWMENKYLKDLKKRYKGIKLDSPSEEEINGHSATVWSGISRSGLITRRSSIYTNASWYCENLNRIYSVTVSEHLIRPFPLKRKISREVFKAFTKEVTSTVLCH